MSTKKWKNKELNTLLNERWGFGMNLGKLNESKKKKPDADGDGVPDWADKKPGKDDHNDEPIEEINMGISGGLGKTPKKETDSAKKQSDKNHAYMKKQRDNKTTVMKEEDKEMGENPEGVTELMDAINGLSEKESEKIYKMLLKKHSKKSK